MIIPKMPVVTLVVPFYQIVGLLVQLLAHKLDYSITPKGVNLAHALRGKSKHLLVVTEPDAVQHNRIEPVIAKMMPKHCRQANLTMCVLTVAQRQRDDFRVN